MGAVVAAVDPGVGRGLVVAASGDQYGVGAGDADAEPAGGAARVLRGGMRRLRVREEAVPVGGVGRRDAAGADEIPAGNGGAGVHEIHGTREAGQGMEVAGEGEVAQAGAGVTAVEDDGEEGPPRDVGAGGGEVVVGKRVLPVEVVRAEDLVEPVGRLVALLVGHLGAVAGVVEDEGVARGGPRGEPGEPVEDRLRGGAGIGQDAHVPLAGEAASAFQRFRHLADVVEAPFQFVARIRIPVDADQQRFLHRRSLLWNRRTGTFLRTPVEQGHSLGTRIPGLSPICGSSQERPCSAVC